MICCYGFPLNVTKRTLHCSFTEALREGLIYRNMIPGHDSVDTLRWTDELIVCKWLSETMRIIMGITYKVVFLEWNGNDVGMM